MFRQHWERWGSAIGHRSANGSLVSLGKATGTEVRTGKQAVTGCCASTFVLAHTIAKSAPVDVGKVRCYVACPTSGWPESWHLGGGRARAARSRGSRAAMETLRHTIGEGGTGLERLRKTLAFYAESTPTSADVPPTHTPTTPRRLARYFPRARRHSPTAGRAAPVCRGNSETPAAR